MKRAIGIFVCSATLALSAVSVGGAQTPVQDVIATGPGESARVVLSDGSSLALGPQTELVVNRFAYDPDTGTGDLIVNATRGIVRFVGGRITASTPAVIGTPASTLTVRSGGVVVSITPGSTVALFVGGAEMKVVAQGETRTVSRAGWQVTTVAGDRPGAAVPTPPGTLAVEIAALETMQADDGRSIVEQAAVAPRSGGAW